RSSHGIWRQTAGAKLRRHARRGGLRGRCSVQHRTHRRCGALYPRSLQLDCEIMSALPKQTPAQEWQAMRLLRLFYVRLAREFALTAPPCEELDAAVDAPSKED